MKNKMTTTIDLDQLLAEIRKSRRHGKLPARSIVKLTLEWELDVDGAGAESSCVAKPECETVDDSAPVEHEGDDGSAENAGPLPKPDWRSTLAHFPDE